VQADTARANRLLEGALSHAMRPSLTSLPCERPILAAARKRYGGGRAVAGPTNLP
jgi:hypothetical protein